MKMKVYLERNASKVLAQQQKGKWTFCSSLCS